MAFYRTIVQVEILSPKPMPKRMSLTDAIGELEDGFHEGTSLTSVSITTRNQRLNERAFRIRAKKQGDWTSDEVQEFIHPEGE